MEIHSHIHSLFLFIAQKYSIVWIDHNVYPYRWFYIIKKKTQLVKIHVCNLVSALLLIIVYLGVSLHISGPQRSIKIHGLDFLRQCLTLKAESNNFNAKHSCYSTTHAFNPKLSLPSDVSLHELVNLCPRFEHKYLL